MASLQGSQACPGSALRQQSSRATKGLTWLPVSRLINPELRPVAPPTLSNLHFIRSHSWLRFIHMHFHKWHRGRNMAGIYLPHWLMNHKGAGGLRFTVFTPNAFSLQQHVQTSSSQKGDKSSKRTWNRLLDLQPAQRFLCQINPRKDE